MQQQENFRILVVDDHTLTAEMTARYLQSEGDCKAAHADSIDAAVDLVSTDGPYNVVLLDLDMPGMNGLRGVERMVAANKPGAVVLFSGQARIEGAMRAIELGAMGFIPKTLPLRSLMNAIRFVALGEVFLPPSFATAFKPQSRKRTSNGMNDTELEVLRGIAKGQTNKDIARELGITEVNVKMHVRSICSKLNVSNRTQIAMTAVMQGFV